MNDEHKPEEKQPEDTKRLGVMSLTVSIKYEDGFENTLKTPDMIGYRPTEMAMLTPNQRPAMVKVVNLDALKKALDILADATKDVEGTVPTEDQVAQAKKEIAAQQAASARSAGPIVVPPGTPQG